MSDLEEIVRQGEGIKDRKLKLFGMRVSGASIMGLFALLSTLVGSLYGGFLLYQKVVLCQYKQSSSYQEGLPLLN